MLYLGLPFFFVNHHLHYIKLIFQLLKCWRHFGPVHHIYFIIGKTCSKHEMLLNRDLKFGWWSVRRLNAFLDVKPSIQIVNKLWLKNNLESNSPFVAQWGRLCSWVCFLHLLKQVNIVTKSYGIWNSCSIGLSPQIYEQQVLRELLYSKC